MLPTPVSAEQNYVPLLLPLQRARRSVHQQLRHLAAAGDRGPREGSRVEKLHVPRIDVPLSVLAAKKQQAVAQSADEHVSRQLAVGRRVRVG